MTKQDIELIARVIREADAVAPEDHRPTVAHLARRFAYALALNNPSFDRARFLAACVARG